MRVVATLLSYPPARWIGSELMTHRLLLALVERGHQVTVTVRGDEREPPWVHEGIPVRRRVEAYRVPHDVVLCHADYGSTAWGLRRWYRMPIIAVCHNAEVGVRVGLGNIDPDIVVCNSTVMAERLHEPNAVIVTPPLTMPTEPRTGDLVTIVNVNENKVGPFWDIAEAMPGTRFLVVLGGYGDQVVPRSLPANVEVVDQVPAHRMDADVWARTRVLLAPSAHESWCMTAAEAMSHGIPVVAHPTPGLVANLAEAGTYVDREDTAGWAQAIHTLADPARWTRASAASVARARVHADADLTQFVEAVEALEVRHAPAAR